MGLYECYPLFHIMEELNFNVCMCAEWKVLQKCLNLLEDRYCLIIVVKKKSGECMFLHFKDKLALIKNNCYYTSVWSGLKNPHMILSFRCRMLKISLDKKPDGTVPRKNGIILCPCTSSNGILHPFEGIGTSDAGKWKNCNTFLSFCLAVLSQIRSRGVTSALCNTMKSIGLLEKGDILL